MCKDKFFEETFEFSLKRGNGEETTVKQVFPEGADIHDLAEFFRSFLIAITYQDATVDEILILEKE